METKVKNIEVSKTARYFTAGEISPDLRQVWFVCHGYGQLANEFLESFSVLDNNRHLIVAPEALHRFYLRGGAGKPGASWMTSEDRLNDINDYINYLDHVYNQIYNEICFPLNDNSWHSRGIKVNGLGFSQGAATVCRWALQGKSLFHRLILWGGDFPVDTHWEASRERLNSMDIQLVYGDADPYIKPEFLKQQDALLRSKHVRVKVKQFRGTHEIHPGMLTALAQS